MVRFHRLGLAVTAAAFLGVTGQVQAEQVHIACGPPNLLQHFLVDVDNAVVSIWNPGDLDPKKAKAVLDGNTVKWEFVTETLRGKMTSDYSLDRATAKVTVESSDPYGSSRKNAQVLACTRQN